MNKIHKAFSKITVDEDLKRRTYHKLREQSIVEPKRFLIKYLYGSLAITCVICFLFIYLDNDISDSNTNLKYGEEEITTLDLKQTEDIIIFNSTIYIQDDILIDRNMLDGEIGITSELHYQDGATIYAIKNIEKFQKIAILYYDEITVFKRKE